MLFIFGSALSYCRSSYDLAFEGYAERSSPRLQLIFGFTENFNFEELSADERSIRRLMNICGKTKIDTKSSGTTTSAVAGTLYDWFSFRCAIECVLRL